MPTLSYIISETDFVTYKKKALARRITTQLIKQGKLKRSSNCELCNAIKKTAAHHTDYGQPTDIMWLCDSCHGLAHRSDSIFNPKNIYQTPIPLVWNEKETVTVSFQLPAKNFIALKKRSEEINVSLSKLLRESILKYYPIQSNQLTLNFEEQNDELIAGL